MLVGIDLTRPPCKRYPRHPILSTVDDSVCPVTNHTLTSKQQPPSFVNYFLHPLIHTRQRIGARNKTTPHYQRHGAGEASWAGESMAKEPLPMVSAGVIGRDGHRSVTPASHILKLCEWNLPSHFGMCAKKPSDRKARENHEEKHREQQPEHYYPNNLQRWLRSAYRVSLIVRQVS